MSDSLFVHSAVYTPGNAPVYNPNAAVEAILPTQVNNPGYLVTQTPTATASQAGAASAAPTKPKGKRGQGNKKPRPTGLVTKLGGTVVKDGATTVHETSVIGTYISGKYAQVLQSTSHVFQGNAAAAAAPAQKGPAPGPKNINPSQTLRILKTAAPNPNKTPRYNAELASIITPSPSHAQALEDTGLPLENLFAAQPASNLVRPSRRLAGPGAGLNGGSFKNRLKNRIGKDDSNDLQERSDQVDEPVGPPVAAAASAPSFGNGKKTNRYRNTQTVKPNNVGKNSSPSSPSQRDSSPKYQQQQHQQQQPEADRRSFKPNLRPTPPEGSDSTTSTSLYKFKLNRSPGRWQYKSPPKPTVNIRKQTGATKPKDTVENLTNAPISDTSVQYNELTQNGDGQPEKVVDSDVDLDQSGSVNGNVLNDAENDNQIERRYPVETIKVEISTPVDFKDTYYEIATIKSPYTFQVPVTTPNLTPDRLPQLVLQRLLNTAAAAHIPTDIASSKPVVKLETVFESHVLPIINGANTIFSTISRPIGTITKTSYEVVTTTLPSLPIPPIPQLNPFQIQPTQQLQLQSTPVVTQTVVTETNSKILKLTFGAKTAYTTLYSTKVVPTQLTTYLTQSVAVQPTAAAFPGYFPAPYAPFPYVG
ncbi:conserved hypothetical protein [Culex quinquefasciatus]|uniref:DUF4758 domain-containing protein n=1 Tax=Culex quinquefasciatus TaxID=7176 RepID=B0XJS4_CULQU|nr:conserved hypothetical protein [Culex quinquefasciatus]|eukprot:XP_001869896.1 conserved hypothetical protein [Culex quinquefasciatus]